MDECWGLIVFQQLVMVFRFIVETIVEYNSLLHVSCIQYILPREVIEMEEWCALELRFDHSHGVLLEIYLNISIIVVTKFLSFDIVFPFYIQARVTAHGRDTSIIYNRRWCLAYIKRLLVHSISNCPCSVGCRYISWRSFGSIYHLQDKDKVCYYNFIKLK